MPSPVFDGFRIYRDWSDGRIDGFAYNLVKFNDGKLQDLDVPHVYAVTALLPGRVIGRQSDLRVSWSIASHLLTLCEFGLFWPGSALRAAGGRVTSFLDVNLTFKF